MSITIYMKIKNMNYTGSTIYTNKHEPGAYISSTSYISRMAVYKATVIVREKIIDVAKDILEVPREVAELNGQEVYICDKVMLKLHNDSKKISLNKITKV